MVHMVTTENQLRKRILEREDKNEKKPKKSDSISHLSAYRFLLAYSTRLSDKEIYITLFVSLFVYTILGLRSQIFSIINRFTDYKVIFILITNMFIASLVSYLVDVLFLHTFSRRYIFLAFLFGTFLVY